MDLTNKINDYAGVLAISDIHGEYSMALDAYAYATKNNLFPLFLGDLVDGADHGRETVELVETLLSTYKAFLIIGNHEEKLHRYAKGNPVTLGRMARKTLEDAGTAGHMFLQTITDVVTHRNADHYAQYGNTTFAHGAVHSEIWDEPDARGSAHRYRSLYGETDGTTLPDGMPNRTYGWVDDIPDGRIAVVGHDRTAMGKDPLGATAVRNTSGGMVVFTDTSAGKDPEGYVTGAVLVKTKFGLSLTGMEAFT